MSRVRAKFGGSEWFVVTQKKSAQILFFGSRQRCGSSARRSPASESWHTGKSRQPSVAGESLPHAIVWSADLTSA